jgi:hypothetical protein
MDILDGLTLSDIQPMSAEKRFDQLREDNIQSFDCDPLGESKKRKDSYVKGPRII